MAVPLFEVTEGWTEEIGPFTLKNNGVIVDLTGFAVTVILRNTAGVLVTAQGVIRIPTPSNGQVYYTPAAADFISGDDNQYRLHFQVVDGAGHKVFFPNGEAHHVTVWPA